MQELNNERDRAEKRELLERAKFISSISSTCSIAEYLWQVYSLCGDYLMYLPSDKLNDSTPCGEFYYNITDLIREFFRGERGDEFKDDLMILANSANSDVILMIERDLDTPKTFNRLNN